MSNKTFSYRLKQLRLESGLTQSDLAERLGVHPGTIARWERGEFKPTHIAWNDVARALGTTVGYLMDGSAPIDAGPAMYLCDVISDVEAAERALDGWSPGRDNAVPSMAKEKILQAKDKLEAAKYMKINDFMTLADALEIAHWIVEEWPDAPQEKATRIFQIAKTETMKTGKLPSPEWIKALVSLAR